MTFVKAGSLPETLNGKSKKGQRVYVGDGIKVGQEGRKMPGVKRLHQESEDVSKPEWIRGHYFSALGLLLSAEKALESDANCAQSS